MFRSGRPITRLTKSEAGYAAASQGSACHDPARTAAVVDDAVVSAAFTRSVGYKTSASEASTYERDHRLERLASSPTLAFLGVEEASLLLEALELRAWQGFDDDDHEERGLIEDRAHVQLPRRWIDAGSARFASSHAAQSERSSL